MSGAAFATAAPNGFASASAIRRRVEPATRAGVGSLSLALTSRRHSRKKFATTRYASFTQNGVYVLLDGSNAQSQSLSDFLI
jgi:hypothetical protein